MTPFIYDLLAYFGSSHLGQITGAIILVLIMCSLFFLSIVWHEFGHIIFLRHYTKKKVKVFYRKGVIYCGQDRDYANLSNRQNYWVTVWGVVMGVVPLLAVFYLFGFLVGIVLTLFYWIGCRDDLEEIRDYKEARV